MIIDAHQHFWRFDPEVFDWITDDMAVIQKDFMPDDLEVELNDNGIDGCVAVQADQSEAETEFLLSLAHYHHSFIKGVVGWVDLLVDDLPERLDHFKKNPIFKGIRHIMQAEPVDFFNNPKLKKGLKVLGENDLTYDVLIYHDQLDAAIELVNSVPETQMVLDHIAKPDIKNKKVDEWQKKIEILAQADHLHCKLSGMVTEADWGIWESDDFEPYVSTIFETFGTDRIMFGSDWPVCKVAAQYREVVELADFFIKKFAPGKSRQIWGGNAVDFYNLK